MSRIVVVGAGLLGSAVADELAALGSAVTVIESGRPASGTSGNSFAWINAQDKSPAPYFELNFDGVRAYPALAAELGGDWYHGGGDIAIGRGAGAPKLTERIERHRAAGYAVRELDRAGIAELEPALELPVDGDLVAAHYPDEAWIDAPALVERRLARATERGAQVRASTPVVGLEVSGGRITGVRTDEGLLAADTVVIAAGAATQALAAQVGVAVTMAPSPGILVTATLADRSVRHVIHAGDVALRPDRPGQIVLSSREVDAGLDPAMRAIQPDAEETRQILARGERILPELRDAGVEQARVGIRSVATDGFPVAGFAPSIPNLYLLVTHSGATLAPVLGRMVALELNGQLDERLAAYRPARFA